MKVAEVRLPDEWEQWSCDVCPFSYVDFSCDDGYPYKCEAEIWARNEEKEKEE